MNILILIIGLLAVGFSGPINEILVKHYGWNGCHVAAGRMLIASGLLWVLGAWRGVSHITGHGRSLLVGGLWLGLHFALWTSAFTFASLSSAVMFLSAQPLISMVLTRHDRDESASRWQVAGLIFGIVGLGMIAWRDSQLSSDQLFGDFLVVLAGLAIVRFQLVTRRANAAMPALLFNATVWGVAGLVLLPAVLWMGSSPPSEGWSWLMVLVAVPTFLGHGCFNRVIPRIKLIVVNLGILAEPVLAITIGWAMDLEQWPSGWRLAGMITVIAGVSLALLSEIAPKKNTTSTC